MKLKVYIVFVLWLSTFYGHSQAKPDVKEQVYVHLNSQAFLSGETLYLSAYCRSQVSGQLSELSKILYIDIVGDKGSVHQQKIKLTNGRGEGEFFIPSVVPSGTYYLLAYTRWMTNFNDYFQVPLLIVNPYESYPNPEIVSNPKMAFAEDNPLVAGVENDLAYHLDIPRPERFSGKLVDNTGQEVSIIKTDQYGIGSVQFTPESSKDYQIILSDTSGSVTFHPLPNVTSEGYKINFDQHGQNLKMKVSYNKAEPEILSLSLSAMGQEIFRQEVESNKYTTIKMDPSQYSMLTAKVRKQNGQVIALRNVYVATTSVEELIGLDTFATRSEVELKFDVPAGSYSVSVRKKLASIADQHLHAAQYAFPPILYSPAPFYEYIKQESANRQALIDLTSFDTSKELTQYVNWLPELREEILTGVLRDSTGVPIIDQLVSLSFPEESYQFRVSKTNSSGVFTLPFKSSQYDHKVVLSTIEPYKSYVFDIQESFKSDYSDFNFEVPYLDSSMVARLLDKNITVQLRNAYYQTPSLQPKVNHWSRPFQYDDQYILDDYERFPTLKETFTEYIVSANVRENRASVIQTTYKPGIGQSKLPPLVLLDGVPVRGADVYGLDPKNVHAVDVELNRLFVGPLVMDGVVDISTKNHQLEGFTLMDYHQEIEVMGIKSSKGVPEPEWLHYPETRIPDLREQLLWISNITLNSEDISTSFYTSDVTGSFEIVLEGFDSQGKPVSKKQEIFIKQDLEL